MTDSENPNNRSRFLPIKDFLKGRSWPTKSSIRFYIFYNRHNFATRCVKRVGRRVLIDVEAFEKWIEEQS